MKWSEMDWKKVPQHNTLFRAPDLWKNCVFLLFSDSAQTIPDKVSFPVTLCPFYLVVICLAISPPPSRLCTYQAKRWIKSIWINQSFYLFKCTYSWCLIFDNVLFFNLNLFNWRLITLQYCIGFAIHQHESATGIYVLNSYSLNSVEEFSLFYN